MPRKPLPEPPPKQRSFADPAARRQGPARERARAGTSIPDLWEAFDVVWGFGEPVEAEPASEAKP